jgi:hypothetical protein
MMIDLPDLEKLMRNNINTAQVAEYKEEEMMVDC